PGSRGRCGTGSLLPPRRGGPALIAGELGEGLAGFEDAGEQAGDRAHALPVVAFHVHIVEAGGGQDPFGEHLQLPVQQLDRRVDLLIDRRLLGTCRPRGQGPFVGGGDEGGLVDGLGQRVLGGRTAVAEGGAFGGGEGEGEAGADLTDELPFGLIAQRPGHGQLVEPQDGEHEQEDEERGGDAAADDEPDHGRLPSIVRLTLIPLAVLNRTARARRCELTDTSVYAGFRLVATAPRLRRDRR